MTNQNWQNEFEENFLSNDTNKIGKALKLKNEKIPTKLYKYRNVNEYSLDCLFNKQIWLDNLNNYNDIYEGYVCFNSHEVIKNILIKNISSNKDLQESWHNVLECIQKSTIKEELIENLSTSNNNNFVKFVDGHYNEGFSVLKTKKNELINNIQTSTKICSFSAVKPFGNEDNNNQLLWAHYGNSYKGFCIEYDKKNIKDKLNIYPVNYSEILDITSFLNNAINNKETPPLFPYYIPTRKNSIWKYEKEWRFISIDNDPIKSPSSNKQDLMPNAIYLGPKISKVNEFLLKGIADYLKITACKITFSDDESSLKCET